MPTSTAETFPAELPLRIPAAGEAEFDIYLMRSGSVWILCFDNWHEDFQDRASAIRLIKEAMSGRIRLRIDRIGGKPFKWSVERLRSDDCWTILYVTSVWRFGWNRKVDTIFRRAPRLGDLEILSNLAGAPGFCA
jgi:hypothetical protein